MRIKIEFEEYPNEAKDLKNLEIWINDFPCRLQDGDMIMEDILGKNYERIMKDIRTDNPIVVCNRFDVDINGYYQNVWLKLC